MNPIVLKDLSPRIGHYLAFFSTPTGTRAYLWGDPGHMHAWLEIRDPLPQVTCGRPLTPGGLDGTAEVIHLGKRLTLAGRVMNRYDARDLLKRLGDPTDVDVEDMSDLAAQGQIEADVARMERRDHVADADEINEAHSAWRRLRGD